MTAGPSIPAQAGHIAIVMHDFSTGGSERIAIRLANQWVRSGRRVTILCGAIDGPASALIAPEVVIITVWPEIPRSAISRVMLGLAFADCIAVLRPDLIFAPGNFHIPVAAALAFRLGANRPALVCKLSNPLGIQEKGVAGLPVITTDCSPAIDEIMRHPSLGQVVPQDAHAVALAIMAMLHAKPPEPAHVQALLDQHRIDRIAEEYLHLSTGR